MRIRTTLGALAGALVLLTSAPAAHAAAAAAGSIGYVDREGHPQTIKHPKPGCINLPTYAQEVTNDTDESITLFHDTDCQGLDGFETEVKPEETGTGDFWYSIYVR
ncbi:hypothetical protein [Kitasatospora sp. NPDC050543]|uniref:hypothetical protein n=1 Tax=Kitasatospora sp. NPDC050543 TaxID=3364054 RepID=UPI00379A99E2